MKAIHIFAAAAACALVFSSCAPKAEENPALKVNGAQLCFADGTPAVFKGVSFGWHNLWPRFYNEGAVNELSQVWGVKMIRAAIGADGHANAGNPGCHSGYIDEPEFAMECLFNVVDAAIANKTYVLVDWHSHVIHFEEAKEFFTKVAERYKGNPYVIYELFNEPVCFSFEREFKYDDLGNPEAMQAYWTALKEYAEGLIDTITSIDDTHPLILMGCPCWDQRIDFAVNDPIEGYDNLMYTVHFYAGTHKDDLRNAVRNACEAGVPIIISECAACNADGDGLADDESWAEWNSLAADYDLSMLVWSIGDKNEFCSMISKEAASEGPWSDVELRPWGLTVKNEWLRGE